MSALVQSRIKIAPSLLNADFGYLAEAVERAEAGGADWIHVDVMDGAFVPNFSMGPMVVSAIRRATTLPLDVHLMVQDPARYVGTFRDAGADWITIHLEADRHPHRTLAEIRSLGARAGLALNPGSSLVQAEELLTSLDLLVIMTVNPGFGGQSFIKEGVGKVARARQMLATRGLTCEIEVDGGVKLHNAPELARAGASVVVAGSFVYEGGDGVEANIRALREGLNAVSLA
jgi:ribulose-phosphate 3-epimerase